MFNQSQNKIIYHSIFTIIFIRLIDYMLAVCHVILKVYLAPKQPVRGILTLEDILETLIGHEIIDEGDKDIDMQKLAKRLWKAKTKKYNIDLE